MKGNKNKRERIPKQRKNLCKKKRTGTDYEF